MVVLILAERGRINQDDATDCVLATIIHKTLACMYATVAALGIT